MVSRPFAFPSPNPPLALRHFGRFELGTLYPTIVEPIGALRATAPLNVDRSSLVVDETGVERRVVDMFHQAGQVPIPVTITAGFTPKYDPGNGGYTVPKRDLVTTVVVLLEQRRLLIPPSLPLAELLIRELQAFKRKITPAGSDTYAAGRESVNVDLVLAVALAAGYREYLHVRRDQQHAGGNQQTFSRALRGLLVDADADRPADDPSPGRPRPRSAPARVNRGRGGPMRRAFVLTTLMLAVLGASAPPAPARADAPSRPEEIAGAAHPDVARDLARARAATARYHDAANALADGYRPATGCRWSAAGAMGIHYVNPALAADRVLDPARPELLLYEPTKAGLRLVAVEYHLDYIAGEPHPVLFGQKMDGPMAGHAPGQPVHYDLHVWLWKANPDGLFAQYTPRVRCPEQAT